MEYDDLFGRGDGIASILIVCADSSKKPRCKIAEAFTPRHGSGKLEQLDVFFLGR